MKKYVWIICMMFLPFRVQAQIVDILGSLGIQGAMTSSSVAGVEKMQRTLSNVQVQQGLAELNAEIQTKYFGDYRGIQKSDLDFDGFKGLEWNVGSDNLAEYYVELSGVNRELCHYLNFNGGAKRVEINGGQKCQVAKNILRLYY